MTWLGLGLALLMLGGGLAAAVKSVGWWPLLGWWFLGGLVMAATLYRFQPDLRPLQGLFNGERYFFVPEILVAWRLIQVAAIGLRWDR